MKKIYTLLAMATLSTGLLSSCLFQEDDAFDESAALRSEHLVSKVNNMLYTPQYGWVMQYFANSGNSFDYYDSSQGDYVTVYTKGYNIYCQFFENGTCILGGDHEYIRNYSNNSYNTSHAYVADTSLFELNEQDGPVLSFNTWNDVLSVFCDPVSPSNWYALNGVGLQGDNEFVIKEISDDAITMKGQRHLAMVRLLRLEVPVEEYRSQVSAVEKMVLKNVASSFCLTSSKEDLKDTVFTYGMSNSVMSFSYVKSADEAVSFQPFISTVQGIRFQHPVDLSFYKVVAPGDTTWWNYSTQEFVFSDDKQHLVSDDGQMILTPNWTDYAGSCVNNVKNQVEFLQTEGDSVWQHLCADLNTAIHTAYPKQSLMRLSFGQSSESTTKRRTGLTFQTAAKTIAGLKGTAKVDKDIITFDINTETAGQSGSMVTYAGKNLGNQFFAVANYLTGSWQMTVDDTFAPSKITLTNTDDASKVIMLNLK